MSSVKYILCDMNNFFPENRVDRRKKNWEMSIFRSFFVSSINDVILYGDKGLGENIP